MDKFDVAVIGGGPGGYIAAIRAAQLGAKVALIEKEQVGGTCLNRGCIPTKALIACTALFDKIRQADSFGITTSAPTIDLAKVIERKNTLVAKLTKGVEQLLVHHGVTLIRTEGQLLQPGLIELRTPNMEHNKITAKKVILAMGSEPASLPNLPFDGNKFISSNEALNLAAPPPRVDIIGGGVIGIHFAVIFSSLGIEVTIYEALPEILPGIDLEIVALIKRILQRKKVMIKTGVKFAPADSCGKSLICVGRKRNGNYQVNEKMETAAPGVYAVGDLVSQKMFAHVAYEQGIIAAENALGGNRTFTYDYVPYGIYTHPEIAAVGLTEQQAREKYQQVKTGKFPFAALGIAQAMGEIEGFIKVISTADNQLLGVHIIGAEATNLIGAATVALKNRVTVDQLAETFQAHPSYPEGLHEAALSTLLKGLHSFTRQT